MSSVPPPPPPPPAEPGAVQIAMVESPLRSGGARPNRGRLDRAGTTGRSARHGRQRIDMDRVDRRCRDVACLVVFVVFWCGMIAISGLAYANGKISAVIFPIDYNGDLCGYEGGNRSETSFAYFPRISADLQAYRARVAADPSAAISGLGLYGVCVGQCPTQGSVVCKYEFEAAEEPRRTSAGPAAYQAALRGCLDWYDSTCFPAGGVCPGPGLNLFNVAGDCGRVAQYCWRVDFETTALYRYCLPLQQPAVEVRREICFSPLGAADASFACDAILAASSSSGSSSSSSGGSTTAGGSSSSEAAAAVEKTFELSSPTETVRTEAVAALGQCQSLARAEQQRIAATPSSSPQRCEIKQCDCNPRICAGPDGRPGATRPQLVLPITLSDGVSTRLPGDGKDGGAGAGCTVRNASTVQTSSAPAAQDSMLELLQSAYELLVIVVNDLIETWPLTATCGTAVPMVLGFLYIVLLRWCAKFLVVLCEILMVAVGIALSTYALIRGGVIPDDSLQSVLTSARVAAEQQGASMSAASLETFAGYFSKSEAFATAWAAAGWAGCAVTVLVICILVACRKSIDDATRIVQEGARAVWSMALLLLYPLVPTVFIALLLCYVVVTFCFLLSAGSISAGEAVEVARGVVASSMGGSSSGNNTAAAAAAAAAATTTNTTTAPSWHGTDILPHLSAYLFFGFLWSLHFNLAVVAGVVGGAVSEWYWAGRDDYDRRHGTRGMPHRPISRSFWHVVRYYLGSMALGSSLVAVIQFLRAVVAYLERRSRTLQQSSGAVRCIARCCHLLCCCFQWCIRYLSRLGFIMVVLSGDHFCGSVREAYALVTQNKARFAFAAVFTHFALLVGKVVIVGLSGVASYVAVAWLPVFDPGCDPNLPAYEGLRCRPVQQPLLVVCVTCVGSYFVAACFLYVMNVSIDAILLSFCHDVASNDPEGSSPERMHLGEDSKLRRALDGKAPENVEKRKAQEEARRAAEAEALL